MKLEEMIIEILASHDGIKTKDKCRVIRGTLQRKR